MRYCDTIVIVSKKPYEDCYTCRYPEKLDGVVNASLVITKIQNSTYLSSTV